MKLLLKLVLGLVSVVVLGLLALNFLLISPEAVRDQLVQSVRTETGRELGIYGKTSLAFWPNAHLVLTDVVLSEPGAEGDAVLIRVPELRLELGTLPLLRQEVAVNRFVLTKPVITVRIDESGRHNWRFGQAAPRDRASAHAATSPQPPRIVHAGLAASGPRDLQALSLNDVQIKNGTVHVIDARRGVEHSFERVALKLSMPEDGGPLQAKGHFDWRGERVAVDLGLASPAALLADAPTGINLALRSMPLTGSFAGNVVASPAFIADGTLAAQIPSVRRLLDWAEIDVDAVDGIDNVSFEGAIAVGLDEISIQNARFSIDTAQGHGQAVLSLTGARPHLRAALAVDRLNLNPFIAKLKTHASLAPVEPPPIRYAQAATALSDANPPLPTRSPLQRRAPGPAEEPPVVRERAPDETLAILNPMVEIPAAPNFEADVNINFGALRVQRLNVGRSAAAVVLRNGLLSADVSEAELYDGRGSAKFMLELDTPAKPYEIDIKLDGVSALPLLRDLAEFGWLSGIANLSLVLNGALTNPDPFLTSVSGEGSLNLTDGSLQGIDLEGFIAGLGQGQFKKLRDDQGSTQFKSLSGNFLLRRGVATTDDLQLDSRLLQVSANGSVDIVRQHLDLIAEPQIVAEAETEGLASALKDLSVPVRVEGPWTQPSIRTDLGTVLEDPDKTKAAIQQLGDIIKKNVKDKNVQQAVDQFLKRRPANRDAPAEPAPREERRQPDEIDRLLE